MKLASAIATLSAAAASATSVSYDPGYDDASRSMTAVSCSDGANGLITKYGWQTQGAIPNFPHIAGWEGISGWGSASCGQCLEVSYNGNTVHVLAIDHAATGVNMATQAMDELTGGNAVQFGRVEAEIKAVDAGLCGVAAKKAKRGVDFMA